MNPKERWDEVFKQGRDFTTFNDIFIDEELLPRLNSKKVGQKFLDIGCGTGDTLAKMKTRGFDVTGLDVSPEAVRIARKRQELAGATIFAADIENGGLGQLVHDQYDLIIVKLVLVFIKDKKSFLNSVCSLLNKDGKLLLITPLLYADRDYLKPATKGIAVDAHQTETQLKEVFQSVEFFHRDFLDDNGVLGYYLCS